MRNQRMINYDIPEESENYVHLLGHTGRGQKKGVAISFCSAEEKERLAAIEVFLDREIAQLDIEKGAYEETMLMPGVEETD